MSGHVYEARVSMCVFYVCMQVHVRVNVVLCMRMCASTVVCMYFMCMCVVCMCMHISGSYMCMCACK